MQRTLVKSSNVKAIGWEESTLEVEFHTGAVYRYANVPEEVFVSLLGARSVGRYFAVHVKPNYQYSRVTADQPKADNPDLLVVDSLESLPDACRCGGGFYADGHVDGVVQLNCRNCSYRVLVIASWLVERVNKLKGKKSEPIKVTIPRSRF